MMPITMLTVSVGLFFSFAVSAQTDLPSIGDLEPGWSVLSTDGVCSTGTPYQFYAKPSMNSNDVLVYFNGGGACWFGEACDPNSQPNVHSLFAEMEINNPTNMKGIFEFDNPENPFIDHSVVVVPYCNGDVHLGAGQKDYTYENGVGDDVNVTVFHNGFSNSQSVLDWVYRNFPSPSRVVVSGSSAGAIGGSFYAGLVSEHYSTIPVTLIADAAGGYASPFTYRTFEAWNVASVLPDWPEYNGETNQSLSFQDFYIASANHNENLTIAQFNTAEDLVQYNFSLLIGDKVGSFSLPQRIFTNYLEIESNTMDFFHYTAGGRAHTILGTPEFYQYSVEGVRFVDWVSDLISGKPVKDVSCVRESFGCENAPSVRKAD